MTDTPLGRARAGHPRAFEDLVAPHRHELHVHCYRLLGSVQDAEDVLQEVMVAAWRGLDRFDGRALRAWLYRIATNRCLNHLRAGDRRPQRDPWWLEPYPDTLIADVERGPEARYDQREGVALAFVAALQRLPPQQRAVLVLRDVLGFAAAEAADVLEVTPAAVNSALQRARATLGEPVAVSDVRRPRAGDDAAVVDRFVAAFEAGDLDAVVSLLTADVRVTMPPEPVSVVGSLAASDFLRGLPLWDGRVRVLVISANGQPAVAYYMPDASMARLRGDGLIVLSLADGGIGGPDPVRPRAAVGRLRAASDPPSLRSQLRGAACLCAYGGPTVLHMSRRAGGRT